MHLRAALAHEDAPCTNHLATVCLYSEPPACRVSAVTRGAPALLMSHQIPPAPLPGSVLACARSSSCSLFSPCTCRRGSYLPADGPGSRPWPSSRRGRTPLHRLRSRQAAPGNPLPRPLGGRRRALDPLSPCTAFHRSLQPQTSRSPRTYQATAGVQNAPHGATVYPPCSVSTTSKGGPGVRAAGGGQGLVAGSSCGRCRTPEDSVSLGCACRKNQSSGPRLQGQQTREGKHRASATPLRCAPFPHRCGAGWDRGPRHLCCRGGL